MREAGIRSGSILFASAGPERLEAMKSGYRTQCDFTEDLAPDIVIP